MKKAHKNIALTILAAGESSRMGQIKQLLPWGNTTLLGNAIEQAISSQVNEIFVVLGANAKQIHAQHEQYDVHWVYNNAYESGMGTSVASAINALKSSTVAYDGILIMLCDQPYIDSTYLDHLIQTFNRNENLIVATSYTSKNGVPAIFTKEYFQELSGLRADIGAKDLIARNSKHTLAIEPKGKQEDLDTYKAYINAANNLK